VIGFNVVYQQFRAIYDGGCQICRNWSGLKPVLISAYRGTMPIDKRKKSVYGTLLPPLVFVTYVRECSVTKRRILLVHFWLS